jgi:hypothetical protein
MMGTNTFSSFFSLLFSFHYTSQNWPSRGREEREKKEWPSECKECQSDKERVRCGTFALHVSIDSLFGQTMSSRAIYDQFSNTRIHTIYIRFKRLSLCIHKGDVEQWHPCMRVTVRFIKSDYYCQHIVVIRLWLILLTLSDLNLVEHVTWTTTDVILSFFGWMLHNFFVNEEGREKGKRSS